MNRSSPRILFVGALTLDTLYQVDDFSGGPGKYLTNGTVSTASGMAANASTAAARLGGCPSLWASVGGDIKAPALISEITAEGVNCDHVKRVPGGRSASATIVIDKTGERWVLVDYDPLTQAAPQPDDVPRIQPFAAVMADVRWPEAAALALANARDAGRLAILDADVAPLSVLEMLAPLATHIVASAPGAQILSGLDKPNDAARKIVQKYGCFACVTDGAEGSFWTEPQSSNVQHIPNPQVQVVDTNGAGDVYHGAFAQALVEGQSIEATIQFASSAAALKCTILGGRLGAPNRKKTLQLMKETYHES